MGFQSELDIAISEAEELCLQLRSCQYDLARARFLLATSKQLVREERAGINQLRSELLELTRQSPVESLDDESKPLKLFRE